MSDPTYDMEEINKLKNHALAFEISELWNDLAPIGWSKYIPLADMLLSRYDMKEKSPGELDKIIIGQECICPDGLGRIMNIVINEDNKQVVAVKEYAKELKSYWPLETIEFIPIEKTVKMS